VNGLRRARFEMSTVFAGAALAGLRNGRVDQLGKIGPGVRRARRATALERIGSSAGPGKVDCAMAAPQDNQLLAMLPADALAALDGHLTTVDLRPEQMVAQPGDDITRVYFPHSGIVSFMVEAADGDVVQTSMVGRDGVIGAAQAIDDKVSINKIVVQIRATATVIDRDRLREAMRGGSAIRKVLAAHEQFFVADLQQTAACNALHPAEARMCRWMLRMMDLVGTDLPLTQEHLARMIGVRRATVSGIATRLQNEGIITYSRGHIRIHDAKRLRRSSCECYEAVRQNYARLMGIPPPNSTEIPPRRRLA
jgi:CRP-like cAMP-binding protein